MGRHPVSIDMIRTAFGRFSGKMRLHEHCNMDKLWAHVEMSLKTLSNLPKSDANISAWWAGIQETIGFSDEDGCFIRMLKEEAICTWWFMHHYLNYRRDNQDKLLAQFKNMDRDEQLVVWQRLHPVDQYDLESVVPSSWIKESIADKLIKIHQITRHRSDKVSAQVQDVLMHKVQH